MTNAQINKAFFENVQMPIKIIILSNISNNYGITNKEVKNEIFDNDAENILDYISGPNRTPISLLYQKFILNYLKTN